MRQGLLPDASHQPTEKHVLKKILTLILLLCFGASLPAIGQGVSDAEYQAKLKSLQKSIDQLQKELRSAKGDREKLLKSLEESETAISDLLKRIDEIKGQLQKEEQALNRLHNERQMLAREQALQKKHIAQQVRAAYQLGGQSNLKLLLNQSRPETLVRMVKYHDYFVAAHSNKIAGYVDNIQQLDRLESEIQANSRALEQSRSQLQAQYQQLSARRQERQTTLSRLEASIKTKDEALQKLEQDRQHIEKLMERIASTVGQSMPLDAGEPFSKLRGKLAWPAAGTIAHRFGSDRIPGRMKWKGVVIQAQEGAPVKAIYHGRVVFADYLRGHGLVIIVDHGENFMSLYAHNQSLSKTVGSWVEAGEIIASVGKSGGQQEAGLYFEIRHKGQATNPGNWCS